MEDFHKAGRMATMLREHKPLLRLEALTFTGRTLEEARLRAKRCAQCRQSQLMEHEGRALVFENAQELVDRIDSDDLDVTPQGIRVRKNIGPKCAPGMPEAGYIPIPLKLARAGIKDIVRISDGRMSGTAFGTIVAGRRRLTISSRPC